MGRLAFVDSSALLKLIVAEPETASLEADFADREGLLASRLAALECRRVLRRISNKRVVTALEQVLDALYVVELTPAILERAAELEPLLLRPLDAIHLATALSIGDPDLQVVTYDQRFADAASANGLSVVQPGR